MNFGYKHKQATKVKLFAFPVGSPCEVIFGLIPPLAHSLSPSVGPRSRSNTGLTTKSLLKSGSGPGLCLGVCMWMFVFASWGHENTVQAMATHPLWGRVLFSGSVKLFPRMLRSLGQGEDSHLSMGLLRNPKYPKRPCIRWKLAAH